MTEFTEQIRLYEPHRRQPRIAAIGGGHGLSAMLRGLKAYTRDITAIVTVADDGGGSGMLREDLGMLPPGDIRNCIMALANTEPTMQQLLNYRFTDGSLAGQSFGNLKRNFTTAAAFLAKARFFTRKRSTIPVSARCASCRNVRRRCRRASGRSARRISS